MATLTTKELAEKLDTSPKTLRRFIRSDVKASGGTVGEDTPGKGGRYSFESSDVPTLKKSFKAWTKSQEEARAARLAKAQEAEAEVEETV